MRAEAQEFASDHLDDPFFVAGVALYWGEGSKTHADLALANSDPRALRLFIAWVRSFHTPNADFALKINLHAGNDEPGARAFWRKETGLPGRGLPPDVREARGHRPPQEPSPVWCLSGACSKVQRPLDSNDGMGRYRRDRAVGG
jgi:hypothetical protein